MYKIQRRILSQNFFYSRKFFQWLIQNSSVSNFDIVLNIGAGKGIITEELLKVASKVVAIEIDPELCSWLENKFVNQTKVEIIRKDFLKYSLPKYPYKVFANIPFCIEGKIIRKLLNDDNPPKDAYLVLREDLATRLSGLYRENKFSIFYKPWFTFSIIHSFRKTDFEPMARMNTVLLRFSKRSIDLVSIKEQVNFRNFIEKGFKDGKSINENLRGMLTNTQLKRLAVINRFSIHDKPSYLSLIQWINIFKFIKTSVKSF